jgi:hypothetical protein
MTGKVRVAVIHGSTSIDVGDTKSNFEEGCSEEPARL